MASDAIMIARGDMWVSRFRLKTCRWFRSVQIARENAKPVIVGNADAGSDDHEFTSHRVKLRRPTLLLTLFWDGTDAVMLSSARFPSVGTR
jgi:pyruvate kinase